MSKIVKASVRIPRVCRHVFSAGAMVVALVAVPGAASASPVANSFPQSCDNYANTQVGDVLMSQGGFAGSGSTEGGVTSSQSFCAGDYELAVQSDGNLVIYNDAGQVPWNSHSYFGPVNGDGTELTLQSDGNLVLYKTVGGTVGPALWATATYPSTTESDFVCFQTDGNLVVYAGRETPSSAANPCFGTALWASGT